MAPTVGSARLRASLTFDRLRRDIQQNLKQNPTAILRISGIKDIVMSGSLYSQRGNVLFPTWEQFIPTVGTFYGRNVLTAFWRIRYFGSTNERIFEFCPRPNIKLLKHR
jgi:hypothetical protein